MRWNVETLEGKMKKSRIVLYKYTVEHFRMYSTVQYKVYVGVL